MDRGEQGLKRSVETDGTGIPLHVVSAGVNRHDSPLLGLTLAGLDKLKQSHGETRRGNAVGVTESEEAARSCDGRLAEDLEAG